MNLPRLSKKKSEKSQKNNMALSYLEREFDEAMLMLKMEVPFDGPTPFDVMNCFLSGMRRGQTVKLLKLSVPQYKRRLDYARKYLRKRFTAKHITADLMLDNRLLTPEVSAKLHFLFPKEP